MENARDEDARERLNSTWQKNKQTTKPEATSTETMLKQEGEGNEEK